MLIFVNLPSTWFPSLVFISSCLDSLLWHHVVHNSTVLWPFPNSPNKCSMLKTWWQLVIQGNVALLCITYSVLRKVKNWLEKNTFLLGFVFQHRFSPLLEIIFHELPLSTAYFDWKFASSVNKWLIRKIRLSFNE